MEREERINVCFQCPKSLYETFKDLVKEDERSMSWTLRKVIQHYISERKGVKNNG